MYGWSMPDQSYAGDTEGVLDRRLLGVSADIRVHASW